MGLRSAPQCTHLLRLDISFFGANVQVTRFAFETFTFVSPTRSIKNREWLQHRGLEYYIVMTWPNNDMQRARVFPGNFKRGITYQAPVSRTVCIGKFVINKYVKCSADPLLIACRSGDCRRTARQDSRAVTSIKRYWLHGPITEIKRLKHMADETQVRGKKKRCQKPSGQSFGCPMRQQCWQKTGTKFAPRSPSNWL